MINVDIISLSKGKKLAVRDATVTLIGEGKCHTLLFGSRSRPYQHDELHWHPSYLNDCPSPHLPFTSPLFFFFSSPWPCPSNLPLFKHPGLRSASQCVHTLNLAISYYRLVTFEFWFTNCRRQKMCYRCKTVNKCHVMLPEELIKTCLLGLEVQTVGSVKIRPHWAKIQVQTI